jgi:hypothetical protein
MEIEAIRIGPWILQANVTATKACYEEVHVDTFAGCGCDPCTNYSLLHDRAYPPEVVRLFEKLGVDPRKPFELCHYGKMPSGLHLYGGWHYVCGSMEASQASSQVSPNLPEFYT